MEIVLDTKSVGGYSGVSTLTHLGVNEMKSIELQNCYSLEQVVELINGGGTSAFSGEEIAQQYAEDAAKEQDDMSKENIDAHLDILREAGAKF